MSAIDIRGASLVLADHPLSCALGNSRILRPRRASSGRLDVSESRARKTIPYPPTRSPRSRPRPPKDNTLGQAKAHKSQKLRPDLQPQKRGIYHLYLAKMFAVRTALRTQVSLRRTDDERARFQVLDELTIILSHFRILYSLLSYDAVGTSTTISTLIFLWMIYAGLDIP